jgi:hypothetical protein
MGMDPPVGGTFYYEFLLKPPSPQARQKMVFGMVLEVSRWSEGG